MKKLVVQYLTSYRGLTVTKKSWFRHVIDPYIIIGFPMGAIFFILSLFAASGIPCLLSDGVPVVGIQAFIAGLVIVFVGMPLLCAFAGSIAWIMSKFER